MAHKVLSLKYRPQRFDELRGQAHVARILQGALAAERVGHAYLFVGPRGVGKTTTARIFARVLNCTGRKVPAGASDLDALEPCGVCSSCVDIAVGSDLDVVEMDAASNNAVDDVRTLREQVGYATVRSRYRIWIVDEVHMLSLAAFNAFLKTLEEPPVHVKFLFCTTEEHKLPDTFRSRCQRVELRPISEDVMTERLHDLAARERVTLEDGLAEAIAHGALGGLRDAESQLEQLIAALGDRDLVSLADLESLSGRASGELLSRLVEAVDGGQAGAALDAVDACLAAGAKPGVMLDQWLDRLREQMVQAARALPGAPDATGYAKPARAIDILLGKRVHLRAGAAGDLVLQVAAVELARLPDARDLDALLVALRAAGAERSGGSAASGGGPEPAEAAPSSPSPRGPARAVPTPVRSSPVQGPAGGPRRRREPESEQAVAPREAPAGEPPVDPASSGPTHRAADAKVEEAPDDGSAASAVSGAGPAPERGSVPIDAQMLLQHWDEIARRVAARNPLVAEALAQGTVQAVRGDALRIALPDKATRARGTLMRREVQLAFGQIVREVLGSYLRIEVVEAPRGGQGGAPIAGDMRVHPSVQRVTQVTGGRLLNVERTGARGAESTQASEARRTSD